ncbi:MAG TPA: metalloregulator ArsR/SmtB family transcription factor [Gemmatimonadales bacterium]|nr:metalloregulator ArsR/SmtB family transcription factor [Gemmatimonadales bacterium]
MAKLTPELMDIVAERFRALGEPMRIRILDALRHRERTVTDLVEATGATQANVSKHLTLLHRLGFVARRKEGTRVFYRVDDPDVFELCDLVCGGARKRVRRESRALRRT